MQISEKNKKKPSEPDESLAGNVCQTLGSPLQFAGGVGFEIFHSKWMIIYNLCGKPLPYLQILYSRLCDDPRKKELIDVNENLLTPDFWLGSFQQPRDVVLKRIFHSKNSTSETIDIINCSALPDNQYVRNFLVAI